MRDTLSRKDDHIIYSLLPKSQFEVKTSWLECVELVHMAVPELDFEEVDMAVEFLGYRLNAPLMIAAMTGGTRLAKRLNSMFARAAEELGVAIGVGSQRVALENPDVRDTFRVVRERASSVPVLANIGASQVVEGLSEEKLGELIEMVGADALAVHLNPLQEVLQVEGQPKYSGLLERLEELVEISPVPIIVKETGAGISREAAEMVARAGVAGVDVGGAGGTSFARVEGLRALAEGDYMLYRLSEDFAEWGIPTAASVLEVRTASDSLLVIATGGIRSGIDVAKAIRLGADICGIAYPVLRAALQGGYTRVREYLRSVIEGLRRSAFLTGCGNVGELRSAPVVIRGALREWIDYRGLKLP